MRIREVLVIMSSQLIGMSSRLFLAELEKTR